MNVTLVSVTVVAALVLGAAGGAKVAAVPDMRRRADHLGYPVWAYRVIGALELAAVAGLVAGFVAPALAVAAAAGLLLMMAGAVVSHVRAGDGLAGAAPALGVAGVVAAHLALTVVIA